MIQRYDVADRWERGYRYDDASGKAPSESVYEYRMNADFIQ